MLHQITVRIRSANWLLWTNLSETNQNSIQCGCRRFLHQNDPSVTLRHHE